MSLARRSGSSRAAKWPPRGEPVQAGLGEDEVVAQARGTAAVVGPGVVLLQQPRQQSGGGVVERVGDSQRTSALQVLVAAFLGVPVFRLREVGVLLRGRV